MAGAGSVGFEGKARFVRTPQVNVTGELKDLTAKEAFALFGTDTDVLEGTGSVERFFTPRGRTKEELVRSAGGRVSIVSRDGVIKKWDLVSKLLAVTNVYDLLAGRVDLSRNGLVYRRMSASFEGKKAFFARTTSS